MALSGIIACQIHDGQYDVSIFQKYYQICDLNATILTKQCYAYFIACETTTGFPQRNTVHR